jgi:hypothetical protein
VRVQYRYLPSWIGARHLENVKNLPLEVSNQAMRSPRGFLAAVVFLLALPMAVLCQVLFGSGSSVVVHVALALGSVLLSFSVFDFRMPRWITWVGCVSAGALAAIFLLQGVADLTQNGSLHYLAYQVLGQWPEGWLPDLVILWLVAMLLSDSRGKTRILGFVAMSIAVCLEVYSHTLSFLGTSLNAEAPTLKLLLLLPFVWLLFESTKKPEAGASHTIAGRDDAPGDREAIEATPET